MVNLRLNSYTFSLYFILYLLVWILIHKAPGYGSGSTTPVQVLTYKVFPLFADQRSCRHVRHFVSFVISPLKRERKITKQRHNLCVSATTFIINFIIPTRKCTFVRSTWWVCLSVCVPTEDDDIKLVC